MYIYDIECLSNYFLVCFLKEGDRLRKKFEISDYQNDSIELFNFLNAKDLKLIGYNCLSYDSQLLEFILKEKKVLKAEEIYKESQRIIDCQYPDIPEWKLRIPHLDLFKLWHYDNKSKNTSLKWLQFSMNWHNVEEMPIRHYEKVKEEERTLIEGYCWNDVESTREFFQITRGKTELPLYKGKNKIELRQNIKNQFGLNCFNWNDVKIGDKINQSTYLKLTQKRSVDKNTSKRSYLKGADCISDIIQFRSPYLQNFLNCVKDELFKPESIKEHKGWKIQFGDLNISFGFGGIHTVDKPRKIETDENGYLIDRDVESMYPKRILNRKLYPAHLGPEWLKGYEWIHNERVFKWKKLAKTDSVAASYSEAYKLAMNGGGFGKTNEVNSWQYDPLVTFSVTLDNQFLLLMLAEEVIMSGIKVLSLNTDGILCKVEYSQKEKYDNICKEWESITGFVLEDTLYQKFIQTSVNDYIAITTTGSIKYKGDFEIDKELHKNKSKRIIPIALKEYFVNGIPIEETIVNHKNIFDFCIGLRARGETYFESRQIVDGKVVISQLQKTIRYFISKRGVNLYKIYEDGSKQVVNVNPQRGRSWYQTLLNKYDEKIDYCQHINLSYYIYETRKIINQIEHKQQQIHSHQVTLL